MKQITNYLLILIGLVVLSVFGANEQVLYVGANSHPHDYKNPEKIKKDIELKKAARINVVCLGHLGSDSDEP